MPIVMMSLMLACPKPTSAPVVPPDDVGLSIEAELRDEDRGPDEDGPIAGPRRVLEGDTEPSPDDLPGTGPLVAYFAAIRSQVMVPFRECAHDTYDGRAESPALVEATLDATGVVADVELMRASGSDALDGCALAAFRAAQATPPPPDSLDVDGTLRTPSMAFVPPSFAPR